MRHRTPKRARQERQYSAFRKVFLDERPSCERCGERSTEVHHKAGRDGDRLLDFDLWAALCHAYITEHPASAIRDGWSLPRTWTA